MDSEKKCAGEMRSIRFYQFSDGSGFFSLSSLRSSWMQSQTTLTLNSSQDHHTWLTDNSSETIDF
jgi:hypothetical protein